MRWKNLAPDLVRQRVIIEGTTEKIVRPKQIKAYLNELTKICGMKNISGPYIYSAHEMGYGGWIHWKSSGRLFTHIQQIRRYSRLTVIHADHFLTKKPLNLPENFLTHWI